ncbi:MAG: hypothetical protein ABIZ49_13705 [Opitutaceae bacterium]
MKKFILFGGLALLVLAAAGYVTMRFFLGSIVKTGVNRLGPHMTQTTVELQGAKISPLSGVGTLDGLTVGNPKGWSAANAVRLAKIHIDVEPSSLFRDIIIVNEIVIDQPEITYETKFVSSNIGDILKNIEQATGGGKPTDPAAKGEKPLKMIVKKFSLRNGKVTLGVVGTAVAMPLPLIELTDLGVAEGGITPAGVLGAVMRDVLSSIIGATKDALLKVGSTSGVAAADVAKKTGAAAGEISKKGIDAVKGFFGGKKKTPDTPAPAPATP